MDEQSATRWTGAPRVLIVAGAFLLASVTICGAFTLKTRHNFCRDQFCSDGAIPFAGLITDQAGAVYGTATGGGANNYGVVFRLVISGQKITYSRLHSFCKKPDCSDGADPKSVLVIDQAGNLYGTAAESTTGSSPSGVVFELSPSSNGWKYSVLYRFCSQSNCTDGGTPEVGLAYQGQSSGTPWDGTSPLYGTTDLGGKYGNGVVYQLTKSGSAWTETVIHAFQSSKHANSLLVDSSGSLFGTTDQGGKYGAGLMFRLSFSNGSWSESVLRNFCNQTNCTDGANPLGLLAMDASGNLYGVTAAGGSSQACVNGCGVVFERSAGGTYSVLYSFCSLSQCADGYLPEELLLESSGNLLGGTFDGGTADSGVLFELVNNSGSWSESVLYNLCSKTGCTDGWSVRGGLLEDSAGDIWGITVSGGVADEGTVFELVP